MDHDGLVRRQEETLYRPAKSKPQSKEERKEHNSDRVVHADIRMFLDKHCACLLLKRRTTHAASKPPTEATPFFRVPIHIQMSIHPYITHIHMASVHIQKHIHAEIQSPTHTDESSDIHEKTAKAGKKEVKTLPWPVRPSERCPPPARRRRQCSARTTPEELVLPSLKPFPPHLAQPSTSSLLQPSASSSADTPSFFGPVSFPTNTLYGV